MGGKQSLVNIREQDQRREQEPGDIGRKKINKTPWGSIMFTLESGEPEEVLTVVGGPIRSVTLGRHASSLGRPW